MLAEVRCVLAGLLLSPVTSLIISDAILDTSDTILDDALLKDLAGPLQPVLTQESCAD